VLLGGAPVTGGSKGRVGPPARGVQLQRPGVSSMSGGRGEQGS
jgi:hypothetical protein